MDITKNIRNLILLLVFTPIVLLSSYLLWNSYSKIYSKSQEDVLLYLSAIAKTTSLQINGDKHEELVGNYLEMDAIKTNSQDSKYLVLHQVLKNIYTINQLKTSIYTLVLDSAAHKVYFAVSSSDAPYFRHTYEGFHDSLFYNFNKGGIISNYEDENGKWLSAFAPIKNSKGKTIAVVEVDQLFNEFTSELVSKLYKNILITLLVILIAIIGMYTFLNKILVAQEQSYKDLKSINLQIKASINYSKRIIESALISPNNVNKIIPESFILYAPKDIVSGDFYFVYPLEKIKGEYSKLIIGVFDCTGHGVPGAILSMLGISVINDIIKRTNNHEPNIMLEKINKQFISHLNQNAKEAIIQDGMDGCLCVIDIKKQSLYFAGANRPLYILDSISNELKEVKGDRFPIGGIQYSPDRKYTNHAISVNKDDKLFLFTDGISDQFTLIIDKEKKVNAKRFRQFLMDNHSLNMQELGEKLTTQFVEWKGNIAQTDDVTVVGIKI